MNRQPEPEYMDVPAEAEVYARADFVEVNQAFAERLVELAGAHERALALDLGTGPADIPVRVLNARPDWRIVALDASLAMLRLARKAAGCRRWNGGVELVLADAKRLALRSRTFDVIFSNSILHHITEVELLWAELRRVGKSGAIVLLRDLARPASPQAARQIVQQYSGQEPPLLREEFYRSLLSAYTVAEVRAQLDRAGLDTLRVQMVSDRHLDVFGTLP